MALASCPTCQQKKAAPPFAAVILGPFWPFGRWQCSQCHSRLRFRLIPFYVVALVALLPVALFFLVLESLGLRDTMWAMTAIPVYWLALYLMAARVVSVDVEA